MKKYIPVKENAAATHLKIETYYITGGMNYFTGKEERRGYYLSVCPVTRQRGCESFTAFSGYKQLLKEASRKSAKAEAEAEKIAESIFPGMIESVCMKNGLEIDKEY